MRRYSLIATLLLLAALLLAACSGAATPPPTAPAASAPTAAASPPAAAQPEPTAAAVQPEPTPAASETVSGGTLRIGRTAAPETLNPGGAFIEESYDIINNVYDTLIRIDLDNKPYPGLATTWFVAEDGRTWSFELNPNATWHDGRPVTSADVKFTWEMVAGLGSFGAGYKDLTSLVEQIETPGPHELTIRFEQPVADFNNRFGGMLVLPQHIWGELPDEEAILGFENAAMVGSGPFRLAEYRPGEFTRLTAVKNHYATPPTIDELIFRVFGSADVMVQALRTDELDIIKVPTNTVVRSLQSEAEITVEIGASRVLSDIFFNVSDPESCPPDGKCTGHPALRDVRVRQALAHATDKQALIDGVLLGLGQPGISLVMPTHGAFFNDQLEDYAFDVALANRMLDEAGYADSDGDGIREMPDDPATPLEFRYSFPSDQEAANGPRLFELVRDQWREVGVELTLVATDAGALMAICCPAFDFDVIAWGWSASADPGALLNIATTEQIPTAMNETAYSNSAYDALYEQQKVTIDEAERIALIHEMQAILLRDALYIIPYYPQNVFAYSSDAFTGWVVEPEGLLDLFDRRSLVNIAPAG